MVVVTGHVLRDNIVCCVLHFFDRHPAGAQIGEDGNPLMVWLAYGDAVLIPLHACTVKGH